MIDGFKQSLSQINSIMWAALSLSLSLLILDPSTENIAILGISVSRSRLLIVVPVVLNGLLLVRQVYIHNVIEIIRRAEDIKELKEIVLAYPLIEFMRWRSKFGVETILLTIFQVILEISPAISIVIFWRILNNQGLPVPMAYRIAGLLLVFLAVWNYTSLRRGVFEPLAGKIETPD